MKCNVEWNAWAENDPLYGASSLTGRNRRGSHPWTKQEFYEYGRIIWEEYKPKWQRYDTALGGECLEIGCGPGRITRQLANSFERVYALDISAAMIRVAREAVNQDKVTFLHADSQNIPLPDGAISAAFSCDVFQHFDHPNEGALCFSELYRVCKPSATLMVHLPLYAWPIAPHLFSALYGTIHVGRLARAEAKRFLIRLGLRRSFMHGVKYETQWLNRTLRQIGFTGIEVLWSENTASPDNPSFRSFVFARKPGGPS